MSDKNDKKKKIKSLDVILVIVLIMFIVFNIEMIQLYKMYGSMPEAYACAIIAALIGECGICGRIFTSKLKHNEKELDIEFKKSHLDDLKKIKEIIDNKSDDQGDDTFG